jgi:hypothetical protein
MLTEADVHLVCLVFAFPLSQARRPTCDDPFDLLLFNGPGIGPRGQRVCQDEVWGSRPAVAVARSPGAR